MQNHLIAASNCLMTVGVRKLSQRIQSFKRLFYKKFFAKYYSWNL